jgi:hypothetical protein
VEFTHTKKGFLQEKGRRVDREGDEPWDGVGAIPSQSPLLLVASPVSTGAAECVRLYQPGD